LTGDFADFHIESARFKKGSVVGKIQLLVLSLGLIFTACGPRSNSNNLKTNNISQAGILGGTSVAPRTATASKSIVLVELLNSDDKPLTFCTGTLIAPHAVLTAGHCFDSRLIPGVAHFNILFEDIYKPMGSRTLRSGVDFLVHPQYDTESTTPHLYDHDLAVAVFSGSIPSGFNIVALDSDTNANYASKEVLVYGYGRSVDYSGVKGEDPRYTAGVLRRGVMKISANYNKEPDRYYIDPKLSRTHVCQGDSGGPEFYQGKTGLKVIGVNSAAIGNYLPDGLQTCNAPSQAAKVAPAYNWIMQEQKNLSRGVN